MKQKNVGWIWFSVLTVLICIGYCLAFFLLNPEKDGINWLWFGVSLIYFLLTLLSFIHMRREYQDSSRPALNVFFCLLYAVISILLTVPYRPVWDPAFEQSLIVCLIVSAVYIIFLLLICGKNRNQMVKVQNPSVQADQFIRSLHMELGALEQGVEDGSLRTAMEQLREDVRYSEPGGRLDTSEMDERILGNLDMLKEDLEGEKTDRALERVKKLRQLIARRNAFVREGNYSWDARH